MSLRSKRNGRERGPVARLEYPFVRCEHRAGPALPGHALCRHLLDPKRLPPVVCIELLATRLELSVIVCRACAAAEAELVGPSLSVACAHVCEDLFGVSKAPLLREILS